MRRAKVRLAALVLLASIIANVPVSLAATQTDFSNTSSSITSAYLAVNDAQKMGGNVTFYVDRLNVALALYMRAQMENSADPSKASADLQNATQIAQSVSAGAPGAGLTGASARQVQFYESVISAAAILVAAALIYLFGDRVYRSLWLRAYSGHVVRKIG